MPRKTKYLLFEDATKGWLRVPVQELAARGLIGRISHKSRLKGVYAYLEEDTDMSSYLAAVMRDGETVEWETRPSPGVHKYLPYEPRLARYVLLNTASSEATLVTSVASR